jgi:hypothetical protein
VGDLGLVVEGAEDPAAHLLSGANTKRAVIGTYGCS